MLLMIRLMWWEFNNTTFIMLLNKISLQPTPTDTSWLLAWTVRTDSWSGLFGLGSAVMLCVCSDWLWLCDVMFAPPQWVGGRYSLWSAIGLSIALHIGTSALTTSWVLISDHIDLMLWSQRWITTRTFIRFVLKHEWLGPTVVSAWMTSGCRLSAGDQVSPADVISWWT